MEFQILTGLEQVGLANYESLVHSCQAPLFYDPRVMLAAERTPLLPPERVFYLVAHEAGLLQAFLPCYLQSAAQIDPFGLLKRTASVDLHRAGKGLFSHITHCYDTRLLVREGRQDLYAPMLSHFRMLAAEVGAEYYGLVNVEDPVLRACAERQGYRVNFMLDRYLMSLEEPKSLEDYLEGLPRDGRQELKRQLRKFQEGDARFSIERAPLSDLEEVTRLCQETTARHGTPHYFPQRPLAEFIRQCGGLVRLFKIKRQDTLVSGFVCFEHGDTLHLWCCGVTYDQVEFSPYAISFAEAYRYALDHGLRRIEVGRLNARIKERLGYKPLRLYSIIGQV